MRFERARGLVALLLVVCAAPATARAGSRTLVVDDFARGRTGTLIVPEGAGLPAAPARRSERTIGVKKVAVLLLNFADDRSQPVTREQVMDEVFTGAASTNAFLAAQSQGRFGLAGIVDPAGDVFGYFELSAASAPCDTVAWAAEVGEQAAALGIDLSGYDHLLYLHNDSGACDYGGIGELPGSIVFLQASSRGAAAHEIGHNLGLTHANALVCQDGGGIVTLSGDCQSLEYGDQFSMMGGGSIHQVNHWEKVKLGWIDAPDIERVETSGTFAIAPASGPEGRRGLRIRRLVDCVTREYYVEYRPEAAFDPVGAGEGVLVRLGPDDPTVGGRSHLLDLTPETGGGETDHDKELGFSDAALAVGATYADAEAGVSITLVSLTPELAEVAVALDETAHEPPGTGREPRLQYFADTELTIPSVTTEDRAVDFEWGISAPHPDVPADGFSLRFEGVIAPATDGVVRFVTVSDDGARLWIDDALVIDDWNIQAATRSSAEVTLSAAQAHRMRFEYFDHGGEAMARLGWQAGGGACQVMELEAATMPPGEGGGGGADDAEDGTVVGACSVSAGGTGAGGALFTLLLLVGFRRPSRSPRRSSRPRRSPSCG